MHRFQGVREGFETGKAQLELGAGHEVFLEQGEHPGSHAGGSGADGGALQYHAVHARAGQVIGHGATDNPSTNNDNVG